MLSKYITFLTDSNLPERSLIVWQKQTFSLFIPEMSNVAYMFCFQSLMAKKHDL